MLDMNNIHNGIIITDEDINDTYYNGCMQKFGITLNNENYIVKQREENLDSSVYSEYVASRFIGQLKIPVQQVYLGIYNDEKVVAIKDFNNKNVQLVAYCDTCESSEDTLIDNKEYTYKDVIYLIDKHTKLGINKEETLKQFWKQFICDGILGNRDRHKGNWGYLKTGDLENNKNIQYKPAPIFDNGGSLFPGVGKVIDRNNNMTENLESFICERCEYFPASVFKIVKDGKIEKSSYYEIFADCKIYKTFYLECEHFKKNIGLDGIEEAINNTLKEVGNLIENKYKIFYYLIVLTRYLHIVERMSLSESYEISYSRLESRWKQW